MGNGQIFVEDFLEHRIYDPVKAHEYYERTKVLKGRTSRKPLRGKKKEGWLYVQDQVRQMKKSDLQGLSEQNKAATQALRDNAKARRDELSVKIQDLLKSVSTNIQAKLDAIPKNLSKEQRAAQVAQIRAAGNEEKNTDRTSRDAEKQKLADELKSTIDDAREKYKASREAVKAKYENVLNQEYDALRTGSAH